MAESKIQWTNLTWNPWHGCQKVSPGCKYCYMYRDKDRYKQDPTKVIRSTPATFNKPIKWNEQYLRGTKVFTCSWSDFFIEDADEWREEAWEIIKETPRLTYQILTKRPERIKDCLPADWGEHGYQNVWLGVSVENQEMANERMPILADIPCVVSFLSIEPILGPIDLVEPVVYFERLEEYFHLLPAFDWVIIGGESGNLNGKHKFRPAELQWFEDIIVKCDTNQIPVFVKQLGTHLAKEFGLKDRHGGNPEEWPKGCVNLNFRQFPKT